MTVEAYVHAESAGDWCLSVSYGGKLAQIRIHGPIADQREELSAELSRLAAVLENLSRSPPAST